MIYREAGDFKTTYQADNQTFPLRDAAAAHEALVGRRTTGSTVLLP